MALAAPAPIAPPLDARSFRDALGRFATGVARTLRNPSDPSCAERFAGLDWEFERGGVRRSRIAIASRR
jgi:hypothetical protein